VFGIFRAWYRVLGAPVSKLLQDTLGRALIGAATP
jgi:hypothetical protein